MIYAAAMLLFLYGAISLARPDIVWRALQAGADRFPPWYARTASILLRLIGAALVIGIPLHFAGIVDAGAMLDAIRARL